jgi:hypothetical protein
VAEKKRAAAYLAEADYSSERVDRNPQPVLVIDPHANGFAVFAEVGSLSGYEEGVQ